MKPLLSECFASSVAEFRASEDKEAFLKGFAHETGLQHVTYFLGPSDGKSLDGTKLLTTYSHEWRDRYLSNNYLERDPCISSPKTKPGPVDWVHEAGASLAGRRFFQDAKRFGIAQEGFTIPIRSSTGEMALISGCLDIPSDQWRYEKDDWLHSLLAFSCLLNEEMHRLGLDTRQSRPKILTNREREVLEWAARGKSCWETGAILAISVRTVEAYVSQAIKKLNAATKVEAVVTGIRLKELDP